MPMRQGDYLRLHIPVDGLTADQRARAVTLGNRVEAQLAALVTSGANLDRLLTKIEGYFPG
jgi:hypothetical protein